MFENGRTVEQIIQTMHSCQELYEDWTMNTVRMKIADVVAGKLDKTRQEPMTIIKGKKYFAPEEIYADVDAGLLYFDPKDKKYYAKD